MYNDFGLDDRNDALLSSDNLQLLWLVDKVVRICLGNKLLQVRLLDKILIALLIGKVNGILFCLESYPVTIHKIPSRLPSNEGVLPSVSFGKRIPVHLPVVRVPFSRLGRGLGWAVDAGLR